MRINDRSLRRLQKQRHMYDIQRMILANPIFKNLPARDQKTLQKLIYKAELAEMYIRDRNIVRINQSFDEIIEDIMDMMNGPYTDDELEEKRRRESEDDD